MNWLKRRQKFKRAFKLFFLALILGGCASTTAQYLSGSKGNLCTRLPTPVSVEIYWATDWRGDQKEPAEREKQALDGIRRFANSSECLRVTGIERIESTSVLVQQNILRESQLDSAQSIVFINFTELGPTLEIGLPVLVRGHTEVKFDLHVYDMQTKAKIVDSQFLWRNGGTFIVKGVKSLSKNVEAALYRSLSGEKTS